MLPAAWKAARLAEALPLPIPSPPPSTDADGGEALGTQGALQRTDTFPPQAGDPPLTNRCDPDRLGLGSERMARRNAPKAALAEVDDCTSRI
jgi:hypothetical protein